MAAATIRQLQLGPDGDMAFAAYCALPGFAQLREGEHDKAFAHPASLHAILRQCLQASFDAMMILNGFCFLC